MTCMYDNTPIGTIIILDSFSTATCYECNTQRSLENGTVAQYLGHFDEGIYFAKLQILTPEMLCLGCGKILDKLQLPCSGGSMSEIFTKKEVEQDITNAISTYAH